MLRRGSKGSHQFSWRNGPRKFATGDRKPLVLSTYLDAQEHLPYADDSAAVTPISEDIICPVYSTLGSHFKSSSVAPTPEIVIEPMIHWLKFHFSFQSNWP